LGLRSIVGKVSAQRFLQKNSHFNWLRYNRITDWAHSFNFIQTTHIIDVLIMDIAKWTMNMDCDREEKGLKFYCL